MPNLVLSVSMSVDLFVPSCVRFTIYFYCCLSVSNLNLLNNIDGWPILFVSRFFSVRFYLFVDVFQSEVWSEFFFSAPRICNPLPPW